MSYPAVQPPPVAAVPSPSPSGRPPTVAFAAALLWLMAGIGLIYAIATVAIVPGTISRFRDVTGGTPGVQRFGGDTEPEYYVAVVWLGAAVALALAVIAFALFVVVGLSLRRGSNAARITTLVVCVLGILAGAASVLTLAAQRSGDSAPWSLGAQLSDAYPAGWIGTNAALSVAQILGYALVGILILSAPRAFFRRSPAAASYPGLGGPASAVPFSGSDSWSGTGVPGAAQPASSVPGPGPLTAGAPQNGHFGYGPMPGYPASAYPASGPPVPGYPGPGHSASGYPVPGHPAAGYPVPGQSSPGYPAPGQAASGYPVPGQSAPAGYGPPGYPAPSAVPPHGYAQPASDVSPYARPEGHTAEADFAPQPPAAPVATPPDPDSPYARPPQTHPDTTPPGPHTVFTPAPQYPPADPNSPYARPTAPADAESPSAAVGEGAPSVAGSPSASAGTPADTATDGHNIGPKPPEA